MYGPQNAIIGNSGTGPLQISSVTINGDFAETDNCVGTLAISQTCTISVSFTPTAAGVRQGTITITDDAAGSPHSIPVAGTGIAELFTSTNFLQFPPVLVGQSSTPESLTLSNSTSSTLGIKQLTLQGNNAADFSQTNDCGNALGPKTSCTITIVFTPHAGDVRSTNLTIVDSSGNTSGALSSGGGLDFAFSSGSNPLVITGTTGSGQGQINHSFPFSLVVN